MHFHFFWTQLFIQISHNIPHNCEKMLSLSDVSWNSDIYSVFLHDWVRQEIKIYIRIMISFQTLNKSLIFLHQSVWSKTYFVINQSSQLFKIVLCKSERRSCQIHREPFNARIIYIMTFIKHNDAILLQAFGNGFTDFWIKKIRVIENTNICSCKILSHQKVGTHIFISPHFL